MGIHSTSIPYARIFWQGGHWGWAAILFLAWSLVGDIRPGVAQLDQPCARIRVNHKGSPTGTGIPVSTTPVTIADANSSRCSMSIVVENTNAVRCGPSTGPYALSVSTTVGAFIQSPVSPYALLGRGAQETWQCVRAGGTDGQVTVIEELP